MAKKTQKKQKTEVKTASVEVVVYKREQHRRPNSVIAAEVKSGKYGSEWKYAVRKLGYNVKAIEVLL